MPLSPAVARELLHTRSIEIRGYLRDDDLFDIEGHITDVKPYGFRNADRGDVRADNPLHDMWVRITIDDRMTIVAAEAVTEHGPYNECAGGAASYSRLVGLRIRPGFLKEANHRLAGPIGCTHIRELLQQVATTAYQSMWQIRAKRKAPGRAGHAADEDGSARLLNTCFAYASSSPAVAKRWPHLHTGPDALHPAAAQSTAALSSEP
jgi:hypothetical protein